VQHLTNLSFIDDYHLLVHPVVLGNGKPLFKGIKQRQNSKLLESRDFGNGVILRKYQPVR
jgi:dihydrofolate reductase